MLDLFKFPEASTVHKPTSKTDYIHSMVIHDVHEHYNANLLWNKPMPMLGIGSSNRIKGFIAKHPYTLGNNEYIHPHVCIEMAAKIIDWDTIIGEGKLAKQLVKELEALHSKDFGKRLQFNETPRYTITSGKDLAENSIRVKIGHTVYVPNEDPVLWRLEGSCDGIIFDPIAEIYEMQRLSTIGTDHVYSTFNIEHWPWGDEASLVVLNSSEEEHLKFSTEPYGKLEVHFDKKLKHFMIRDENHEYFIRTQKLLSKPLKCKPDQAISVNEMASIDDLINLEIKQLKNAASAKQAPNPIDAKTTQDDGTFIPSIYHQHLNEDGTYIPFAKSVSQSSKCTLVGIAFQKMSVYQACGIKSMGISFTKTGQLVPKNSKDSLLNIIVDSNDNLKLSTNHGERALSMNETISMSDELTILFDEAPQQMQDIYHGICRLPIQTHENIGRGVSFPVGREKPIFKRLRPLSEKGYIEAGSDYGNSADRMGFSRNAFEVEVTKDRFNIQNISENQVLYHLDGALGFVAKFDQNTDKSFDLPSGHHLIAGPYVWRFDA